MREKISYDYVCSNEISCCGGNLILIFTIAWPDHFIEHASSQDELQKKYSLTIESIANKVKAQFGEAPANLPKLIEVA